MDNCVACYLLVSLIAALNHCCNLFALFLNGTLRGEFVHTCSTVHRHQKLFQVIMNYDAREPGL